MKKIVGLLAVFMIVVPSLVLAKSETITSERQQFQEKVAEMKDAKAEVKEQAKAQVLSSAKNLATKSIDRVIVKYQHFIDVVSKLPNISDQNKLEYINKINLEIAKLTAKKTEITAAISVSEVKAVIETVKSQVLGSNGVVKLLVNEIKKSHLENIVTQLDEVVAKLELKISDNKTKGSDVLSLENLLGVAKSEITSASTKIAANDFVGAKNEILAARDSLSDIITGLNSLSGKAE